MDGLEWFKIFVKNFFLFIVDGLTSNTAHSERTMPSTDNDPVVPVKVVTPPPVGPVVPPSPPTYLWDTVEHIRHSIRVICDEQNLTVEQKNTLCATIGAESEYTLGAINRNYAFKMNGTKYLASTDYGLCQWNDYWHGSEISPTEALHNPEKAVKLMCTYWKRGLRNQWIGYKSGNYLRFL